MPRARALVPAGEQLRGALAGRLHPTFSSLLCTSSGALPALLLCSRRPGGSGVGVVSQPGPAPASPRVARAEARAGGAVPAAAPRGAAGGVPGGHRGSGGEVGTDTQGTALGPLPVNAASTGKGRGTAPGGWGSRSLYRFPRGLAPNAGYLWLIRIAKHPWPHLATCIGYRPGSVGICGL